MIERNNVHILTGVQSTPTYNELIRKIERFSELFCSVLVISIVLQYWTSLPNTYVKYYILDMGEDSFILLGPNWFVLCHKT